MIMRSDGGGIDLLAEDATYRLPAEGLRALLFYGNRVRLTEGWVETDRGLAMPGPDRRWIRFVLGGTHYLIHRSRLGWVARGDVPADRLFRLEAP